MKGLDTNILVRYLVQDDPAQSAEAAHYIHQAGAAGEPCFINHVVLVELVWVLESAYGFDREAIADVLAKIVATRQFEIEEKDIARLALDDYQGTRADFSDCLIGHKNIAAGCVETATFDKTLRRLRQFRLL